MSSAEDFLVPMTLFITPGLVAGLWIWLRYRHRRDLVELVRVSAEKGHQLDPASLEILSIGGPQDPERDMRRGTILVVIALATLIFGALQDSLETFAGIAAFPGLIGLAYLGFWMRGDQDTDQAAT